jgi:hypothetical protein
MMYMTSILLYSTCLMTTGALSVFEKLRENALELNNVIINDDENDQKGLTLDIERDDETDEEVEEGEEEIGWNENDNVDFDINHGTGDYDLHGKYGVTLFNFQYVCLVFE